MAITNSKTFQLLSRLRRAIHKVKFLLSFNPTRWVVFAIIGSSTPRPQLVSFSPRPSLSDGVCAHASSFSNSGAGAVLSRTSSSVSSTPAGDDINSRADVFIANFYKHIQMERQVSLELRYCGREKSLERTRSD